MSIGEACRCKVVAVFSDTAISQSAKLMKENNIGNIVVVDGDNKPVGIITDRDIVIKVIADEASVDDLCAGDIMSGDLLVLKDYQSIQEALAMMCAKKVRRAPIVDSYGTLVGIATTDDLIMLLADEMGDLADLIGKQLAA
jgi:predicted transcriptional regulator